METAIRWSPTSDLTSQRFLFAEVLNRSFSLGRITSYHPSSTGLTYDFSPAFRQVPAFRAFDWAAFNESLVAVGTPSGDTTLLNIDDADLTVNHRSKSQRPCNAVAFSGRGLLASGLERSRNDFCLNVWDTHAPVPAATGVDSLSLSGKVRHAEPLRRLAGGDAVSSIKFFASQPDVMVVGVKGVGIRCYDTRDGAGNASMQFPTHCVHNVAIDPMHEVHFASAGTAKDTKIQVWDVRMGLSQSASNFSGLKGSSFSSNGEGMSNSGPLLEYEDVFNSGKEGQDGLSPASIWSLRYCKGKSGILGSLASNGDFKMFETQEINVDHKNQSEYAETSDTQGKDHVEPIYTRYMQSLAPAFDASRGESPSGKRIVSFDFTNLAGQRGKPTALILRADRSIEILETSDKMSPFDVSSSGYLACRRHEVDGSGGEILTDPPDISDDIDVMMNFHDPYKNENDLKSSRIAWVRLFKKSAQMDLDGGSGASPAHIPSFERHRRLFGFSKESTLLSADEALTISSIPRQLCMSGYGLNSEKNVELLSGNPWLGEMWTWIARMDARSKSGRMKVGPLDLSYLGVYRLWYENLGNEQGARGPSTTDKNFAAAVKRLVNELDLPNHITGRTIWVQHRQLCLFTLGLALKEQDLAGEVKRLAREGQQTKAAAHAIMLGHNTLAVNALKAGKVQPHHRALAIAIAGYVKGTTDDSWNDVVQEVLQDVRDPYSRAIFALVKQGSWADVLKQISLPLRERVGIALLHLSDDELSNFLNGAISAAIREGDVEGIILTGLTEAAVPLFDKYIRTFADLQTPVLALAHASPRFFTHPRVDTWRHVYRSWMDSWRLYAERSRFDVEFTKLSMKSNGESTLEVPPRQHSLACNFCEKSLHTSVSDSPAPSREDSITSTLSSAKASILSNAKFGTICPKCGAHMPRCVICAHWLGMPDHETKYGSRAVADKTKAQSVGNMVSMCQKCLHMTHVAHAEAWFAKNSVCPKVECQCRCQEGPVRAG